VRCTIEIVAEFAAFHTRFHTFCLALHGPAWPDFTGLTRLSAMVISVHPDYAASLIKWRGERSTALPEMVVPSTTGQEQDRAAYLKAPMGT
jgi:hypothetical protein